MNKWRKIIRKIRKASLKVYLRRRLERFISKHFKYFGTLIGIPGSPDVSWSPAISEWAIRGFQIPSPPEVKRTVLKRHGTQNATWLETGTYLGTTTAYLAEISKYVYTIEPSESLFQKAKSTYGKTKNIEFIHGTSETHFQATLSKCSGSINVYLDGHYSEGETLQGSIDTPLELELNLLIANRNKFKDITLFIDDVRCMNPNLEEYSDYPSILAILNKLNPFIDKLVIEHDILIAFFKPNREFPD